MGLAQFKRVTDLFVQGREVVFQEEPEPLLAWAQKLNPFEYEEARRDGLVARSRVTLQLQDASSDDYRLMRADVGTMSDDALIEAINNSKSALDIAEALDGMRADDTWSEKLDVLERTDPDEIEGDEGAQALLAKLNTEYVAEIRKRVTEIQNGRYDELSSYERPNLEREYEKDWREMRGMEAFQVAFQSTEVFFGLRSCRATTRDENGRWQHHECDHSQRVLDDRSEVRLLPGEVLTQAREALQSLALSPRDARDSRRPGSSSAPSPRPSAAGESSPSTQEVTSPELAGTST